MVMGMAQWRRARKSTRCAERGLGEGVCDGLATVGSALRGLMGR
jgi:hypothetical protein